MALELEDRDQAETLRATYERRLRIRERQLARKGDDAEPFIELDIEELRTNIAALNEMLSPQPADEVQRLLGKHLQDNQQFLFVQAVKTNQRVATLEEKVGIIGAAQHAAGDWRLDVGPIIEALNARAKREDLDAPKGRRRTFRFLVFISVVLVLVLVGVLVLFVRVRSL